MQLDKTPAQKAKRIIQCFFTFHPPKINIQHIPPYYFASIHLFSENFSIFTQGRAHSEAEAINAMYENFLKNPPIKYEDIIEIQRDAMLGDALIKLAAILTFDTPEETSKWLANFESDEYLSNIFNKIVKKDIYRFLRKKFRATVVEAIVWRSNKHLISQDLRINLKLIRSDIEHVTPHFGLALNDYLQEMKINIPHSKQY